MASTDPQLKTELAAILKILITISSNINVPYKAKVVKERLATHPNIELVFLPSNSPQLNPV